MKLNLGCGMDHKEGWLNVDKEDLSNADLVWDLDLECWPWLDSEIKEIEMKHSLEHMGETLESFKFIIQEIYRVLDDKGIIKIWVPKYDHPNFWHDPTHVRAVTPTT